jgi:uncharacterized RDD family membrane protein YckC
MKCIGCGHTFTNSSSRCPRCHRSTSRRGRNSKDSRLLEFPKRVGVATQAAVAAPVLPAWRVELNEKVRAIRARKASSPPTDTASHEATPPLDLISQNSVVSARTDERLVAQVAPAGGRAAVQRSEMSYQPEAPPVPARRSSSNIVEAALTRVKRASENASRAALSKIEPARPIHAIPQVSRGVEREATARALQPIPEPEPQIEYAAPAPKPALAPPSIARPANVQIAPASIARPANVQPVPALIARPANVATPQPDAPRVEPIAKAEPVAPQPSFDEAAVSSMPAIDEIEPLDYLEAEVRKVDKTLGSQFVRDESPSLFTHAVIGAVDLIAIAVSCSPFVAAISISNGSFSNSKTGSAAGIIVAMVAFFYLALTQFLSGRTFGMMLTNTRVVDSLTFKAPAAPLVLLRTVGYFVAAAPALLGFLWAAFNRKHRGWQDIISGTIVVRDF